MIELVDVHKTLSGKGVLRGVNLRIEAGETVVIIGGSGTGKSVTLKHIIGLMRPDSGKVIVKGSELTSASRKKIRRIRQRMGVLFQSGALLNWMTIAKNVALPLLENTKKSRTEIDRIVDEKLDLVDLLEARDKYPSEISGGMKKRAGLARALATEPEIILCDEPTSGLDPVMSNVINNILLRLQQELSVTTVVVTHDMNSAYMIADHIAMLYRGRIIAYDTPMEMRETTNPVVRQFIRGEISGPILANKL